MKERKELSVAKSRARGKDQWQSRRIREKHGTEFEKSMVGME